MAEEERKYIIPFRKELRKVPYYKKTGKAVKTARAFLKKHMKVETVKFGKHLNEYIWSRGRKNPPMKVEIHVKKFVDKEKNAFARAELIGFPIEEEKKEVKKKLTEKLKEKILPAEKEQPKTEVEQKEEAIKEEVMKHPPEGHKEKGAPHIEVEDKTRQQKEYDRKEQIITRPMKKTK